MKIRGTHKGFKNTAVYWGIGFFRLSWGEPRSVSHPMVTPTPLSRLKDVFVPP